MGLAIRAVVLGLLVGGVVLVGVGPSATGVESGPSDGGNVRGPAVHTCSTEPCPTPSRPSIVTRTPTQTPSETPTVTTEAPLLTLLHITWGPILAVVVGIVGLLAFRYGR